MWTILKVFIELVYNIAFFWFFGPEACGILAHLHPLHWKTKSLTTGPPGRSLCLYFKNDILLSFSCFGGGGELKNGIWLQLVSWESLLALDIRTHSCHFQHPLSFSSTVSSPACPAPSHLSSSPDSSCKFQLKACLMSPPFIP